MSRRMRITFTYSRGDVASAVADAAMRRGCDPQAVINEVLARFFVDKTEAGLAEQVAVLQGVVRHLTQGAAAPTAAPRPPAPIATPAQTPVAVPPVRVGRKNEWE